MSSQIVPRRSLSVEGESRDAVEDCVGGEERRAEVNSGGCDPQVVRVDRFVERMSNLTACMTKLRDGRQQSVTHRDDCRRCDRLLEPLPAGVSPPGDESAVAKLGDGDGCEEDLLAGHEPDLRLEAGAAASADGRAEDAGVDEDPHDSSAAAKASSSSSDSSSINRASIESSTGAASS